MSDQLPLPGPQKGPCGCGDERCTLYGTPRKNGHVRGCKCKPCQGGRNRRNGMSAQRKFQKKAGIKQAAWRGANGNEESWRDAFRWEHKADGVNARPVVGAFLRCEKQADQNKAQGDPRPFAAGFTYYGRSVVAVDAEVWAAHVAPLLGEAS